MNYLSVEKVSKTYGEKLLFHQITFGLERGQKMALIARNGTGKSTLLNIIAGMEQPDEGQITIRSDIKVAYLPQLENFPDHFSVLDAIFDAQTPAIRAIRDYEKALNDLQQSETPERHAKMEKAIEEMERLHAWDFESKAKEILSRFGIEDVFQNMGELSGGQRKKAALARAILAETDFLILDEPTNHLDIEMIEWLEDYLTCSNTTLLMVTHDRHFLDRVCDEIIELEGGNLYHYKGKYDYYLEKKAERIANAAAENERIRQLYRKELEWVHTSPQARTSKAKARIDAFLKLQEAVGQKTEQASEAFHVQTERLGNKILEINNLDFSFPAKPLLEDFSYIFKRGEKCGVVGKNGTGKSTFLKLIMGELEPDAGRIVAGTTIKFGYFSQEGMKVQGNKRIIDIVKEKAEMIRTENGNYVSASQFLNHFGFRFEQQYTYYEDLSGGEKRKLHLLITLMQNPNFLILDEPTNDFDIDTLNLLEDFLANFKGCLLIVSHDRWFMNKLVDHIFVFEGNGKVKDYYGNYTEYKLAKDKEIRIQKKAEKMAKENGPKVEAAPVRQKNQNRLTFKEKKELEEIEALLETMEKEKEQLLALMSTEPDGQKLQAVGRRYQEVNDLIEEKTMRWLELSEKEG